MLPGARQDLSAFSSSSLRQWDEAAPMRRSVQLPRAGAASALSASPSAPEPSSSVLEKGDALCLVAELQKLAHHD